MKYWFYSEGNILGPYAPSELLYMPAFSQGSLVCPETSTGDSPGDWQAAERVAEISEALSVGVGGLISARSGGLGGMYELETGFSSDPSASFYGAQNDPPYGYENLLNTIDNILGVCKESEFPAETKAAPDYGMLDSFDIRLSKIQEELEAARWEKNLLLEKIRAKEAEEFKNRERISELEEKLKGSGGREILPEQARPAVPEEQKGEGTLASRKFKSLGRSPAASFPDGGSASINNGSVEPRPLETSGEIIGAKDERPVLLPVEPAPGAPSKPALESDRTFGLVPPPESPVKAGQADGGAAYDFSVPAKQLSESDQAPIQRPPFPASPAPHPSVPRVPSAAPQPQNAWQSVEAQASQRPASQSPSQSRPVAALNTEPVSYSPFPARDEAAPKEKTERTLLTPQKRKEEAKKNTLSENKGRGKVAFLATLVVFAAIAAGGLGYFFLGTGVSVSEFSMMNFNGGGKSRKASFSTQLGPQTGKAAPALSAAGEEDAFQGEKGPAAPGGSGAQNEALPAAAAPAKPAVEIVSNENTRKALEIVKSYKLSGGRGSVAGWFANSFLSNSAGGSNEEWSATILHGDIFVVQYRLLRPKQDPLVYQFEVDVPKNLIVRGINNNAIDLLDFSSKVTAKAAPAPKAVKTVSKAGKAGSKAGKPRGIAILPLPDGPAAGPAQEEPTGFEAVTPEANEKVKYIMAQESDEELF